MKPEPPRPFLAIPEAAALDARLDGDAFRLLAFYIRELRWYPARIYSKPDAETAAGIGVGITKFRAARKLLARCGYIELKGGAGAYLTVRLISVSSNVLQRPMNMGPMATTARQPRWNSPSTSVKYDEDLGEIRRGSDTNSRSPDLKKDLPQYLARQERSDRSWAPRRKTTRSSVKNTEAGQSLSRQFLERIARHG